VSDTLFLFILVCTELLFVGIGIIIGFFILAAWIAFSGGSLLNKKETIEHQILKNENKRVGELYRGK